MRIERIITLVLVVPYFSCAFGQQSKATEGIPTPRASMKLHERSGGEGWDAFQFDIVQHTCALYVAVRSAALEKPVEFGREVEDSMVHWNMCPGGKMVACTVAPTANGDTIVTGIPFARANMPTH